MLKSNLTFKLLSPLNLMQACTTWSSTQTRDKKERRANKGMFALKVNIGICEDFADTLQVCNFATFWLYPLQLCNFDTLTSTTMLLLTFALLYFASLLSLVLAFATLLLLVHTLPFATLSLAYIFKCNNILLCFFNSFNLFCIES